MIRVELSEMDFMSKVKAVIFDMDGVLIDAKNWHYEALNRALKLFGYSINRYDHLTTFDGLPTKRKLEILTLDRGLPAGLHSFLNELKQLYTIELVHARCKPIFQHEYALSNLKSAGFKLAVASNSVRSSIELMMQKSNLIDYLDLFLSNQDVKAGKPDPEIYEKVIFYLGLSPAECLVVEDNENGIKAAQSAGANLMVVKTVYDVTLDNINNRIQQIEEISS
jgi:beta-phosphoglucomutase